LLLKLRREAAGTTEAAEREAAGTTEAAEGGYKFKRGCLGVLLRSGIRDNRRACGRHRRWLRIYETDPRLTTVQVC